MDYDAFISQEQGKETDGCLSNEVGTKGRFSVMQKDKGEIMLLMDVREGEPDDNFKHHPCLVPYEDLLEEEKEYDRITSIGTLKPIMEFGFKISQ